MTESEEPTTGGPAQNSSDDTVELELTGEQGVALSQAAEAARPDESRAVLSAPEYKNFAFARMARIDFLCNMTFALAGVGIVVFFLWPAVHRHLPTPAVASTASLAMVTPARLAKLAEPQGTPVRIKNAFDATEVFEFPLGTSESEAREAVAELLLSRARDRHVERLPLRRAVTLQRERGAALQQPNVFVTR